MSVDHVSVVFVARVDCRLFYYSTKTDSWGRSLKVTAPAETKPPVVALAPR